MSVVELPVLPRPSSERAVLSAGGLVVCRVYVAGRSVRETADFLNLSVETVKRHVRNTRAALVLRGYDVSNPIRLRKALREEGLLEGLGLI